jgi:hypothetical protein
MGSLFIEDHLSTFANILHLFEGSVRRELIADAHEIVNKRISLRQQGHQPRVVKRLKEEHLSLIIKYRMHTRYGAPLCIALGLIIGCHPHLVNSQWAAGNFEVIDALQSLPIDEDTYAPIFGTESKREKLKILVYLCFLMYLEPGRNRFDCLSHYIIR